MREAAALVVATAAEVKGAARAVVVRAVGSEVEAKSVRPFTPC